MGGSFVKGHGIISGLYTVMDWISKLFILQVYWTVFTILGFGIFGIFPATAAMFAVTRKWIRREQEIPILKTFKEYYFKDFSKANLSGWSMATIGFILFFYSRLFKGLEGVVFDLLFLSTLLLGIIYIIMCLFWAPVFVHFRMSILQLVKTCFVIALGHPFHAVAMLSSCGVFYLLVKMIPGLFPFFSFSVLAFVLMWFAYQTFKQSNQNDGGIM